MCNLLGITLALISGQLPKTEWDNKYILTVSYYCTKWVAAFPLTLKAATGVAISLFQVKFVSLMGQKREGKGVFMPPKAIHDLGITTGGDIGPRVRVQQLHQPGTMSLLGITHAPTNNSVSPTGIRIL